MCYFKRMGAPGKCDGPTDPCHLIPKQRLKQAGIEELWDPRIIVLGCRYHHGLFDRKLYQMPLYKYPSRVEEYAEENRFAWNGPLRGWRALAESGK